MPRRKLLVLLAVVAFALLVYGSLLWTQPRQVTQKNFERIRIGMRYPEVQAILGTSGGSLTAGKETDILQNDELWGYFGTNKQWLVWREKGRMDCHRLR
jgi:hypothetical protein